MLLQMAKHALDLQGAAASPHHPAFLKINGYLYTCTNLDLESGQKTLKGRSIPSLLLVTELNLPLCYPTE